MSTLEFTDNIYSNDNATKDVAKTLGKKIFDHTKPIALIDTICDLCLGKNDIIMDFFSGSGTSAEGWMWTNAYSNGSKNNKFILIQLQEKVKPGTKAYNAPNNYRTIDQIGMSRIIKAATLIKQETNADIDYGFKGKQDEYTYCHNCKHSFLTEIRFGKVWKIKADEIKEDENGIYLIVEGTQKTMYPNGKDINALKG